MTNMIDLFNYRLSNVESRLSALERAKASQPAPEQPTTPAAGVESAEAFAKRVCNSQVLTELGKTRELVARDAALTKAARERAIGECIQAIADSLKGQAMTLDQCWGIDFATAALSALTAKIEQEKNDRA